VPGLLPKWKEIAAISFIEQCVGHGDGVTLTITGSGYSVSYLGGSSSASGGPPPPRPSPDLIAGYRAFQSLKPDPKLNSYCDSLKRRAREIQRVAEDLARAALLLSEGTILKGTCDFIKSEGLSD